MTESFLQHRSMLTGLAYRMTGSHATAEDIAQEVFLRWQDIDHSEILIPRAWMMKVAARLALDHLKSAQVRRETYIGPWLPEPILQSHGAPQEDRWITGEDVSFAFLLTLERLSPTERAVFILHDLFDMPFAELSSILHKSEAACRQLAVRARQHIGDARTRQKLSPEETDRLTRAFFNATQNGDETALRALLAEDAVLHTDGGGIRPAALNLIVGAEKSARMLTRLALKKKTIPNVLYSGLINNIPGFITEEPDGLPQVTSFDYEDGVIRAIYIIRNPEKISRIIKLFSKKIDIQGTINRRISKICPPTILVRQD